MSDEFEKKSSKKIGIIAVVAVLIIAAVVGGILYLNSRKKPDKIFESAIEDAFNMTEKKGKKSAKVDLELTASASGKDAQVKMINSILQDIKLKISSGIDLDKKIYNGNIVALYGDDEVINATALIQNEKMYFFLKNLYSKYIEIDKKYFEESGLELATIFETGDIPVEKLSKDVEKILVEKVNAKELEQEKVELNGENVQKTTLKLTAKDIAEIARDIMKKYNEYKPTDEIKELLEEIDENIDNIEEELDVEISIYTKGAKNEIVKVVATVAEEDYMAMVIDGEKKSKNETIITISINEEDSNIKNAKKIAEITINEENEDNGTIAIKAEVEGITVAVTAKYSIDYKANIEAENVSNSILIDDLSDEDANEIMENIQNNEFLSSILGNFMGAPVTSAEDYEYEYGY